MHKKSSFYWTDG